MAARCSADRREVPGGPTVKLPSAALRSANFRLQGKGQGAVSTRAYLAEMPFVIDEIDSGGIARLLSPLPAGQMISCCEAQVGESLGRAVGRERNDLWLEIAEPQHSMSSSSSSAPGWTYPALLTSTSRRPKAVMAL
jgi:hypothetical protein